MSEEFDLNEIKRHLSGKTIFLMPYCHADHAWLHSRDWHERRYLTVFDQVTRLLKENEDFKFFVDSWSEFLKPCLKQRPEDLSFWREMVKIGRVAIVCGQWSNLRPTQVGDESLVRNLIYGRRQIQKLFPEARLDAYANLDTNIGHSQLPQLLRLSGCVSLFAWRPDRGLDDQGVPRVFVWEGLSNDQVTVRRHMYQGWFAANDFPCSESGELDFDAFVKTTWERYLKSCATQDGLNSLSFCHGGDDCPPHTRMDTGEPVDTPELMERWNQAGYGQMRYGTPYDAFDAVADWADIPLRKGTLDSCEVGYNIAFHGDRGIWKLRDFADRELVLAENLSTLASLQGVSYPEEKLERLWRDLLTYCTHALEFLFEEDFDKVRFSLRQVLESARKIQRKSLRKLCQSGDDKDLTSFSCYNPLPEKRSEIVMFDLPNTDQTRQSPVLYDESGEKLDIQSAFTFRKNKFFHLLARVELPPSGFHGIDVKWERTDPPMPAPSVKIESMDLEITGGNLTLNFEKGHLKRIRNNSTGEDLNSTNENASWLEPMALPQKIKVWMSRSLDDNPSPFNPTGLSVLEKGPLRWRIMRKGDSGVHSFRQYFDIYQGEDFIELSTIVDISPDSAKIVLGVPLEPSANIHADIPFGVEERNLNEIKYGFEGGGHFENIERQIPGVFWGRSWVHASFAKASFGLISMDGPKYFRRHGDPLRLLHFLAHVPEEQEEDWTSLCPTQRVLGRNEFKHRLLVRGKNWRDADIVSLSNQARQRVIVAPGKAIHNKSGLSIQPNSIRTTAFYREGDDFFLRLVNISPEKVDAEIEFPDGLRFEDCSDFSGEICSIEIPPRDNSSEVRIVFEPWKIVTLRLRRF